MTIHTKFDIGDVVRPGVHVDRIIVRFDSQYFEHSDVHYVLSDGYYVSEKELSSSEIK